MSIIPIMAAAAINTTSIIPTRFNLQYNDKDVENEQLELKNQLNTKCEKQLDKVISNYIKLIKIEEIIKLLQEEIIWLQNNEA